MAMKEYTINVGTDGSQAGFLRDIKIEFNEKQSISVSFKYMDAKIIIDFKNSRLSLTVNDKTYSPGTNKTGNVNIKDQYEALKTVTEEANKQLRHIHMAFELLIKVRDGLNQFEQLVNRINNSDLIERQRQRL